MAKSGKPPEIDFAAEGLLKGLRGKARKAREELLRELVNDGVSLDDLRRAVEEDRLALLPAERVLGAAPHYTAHEIAERSGVELDVVLEQRRALGVPVPDSEECAFSDEDLYAARRLKQFLDVGVTSEDILESLRVLGEGMSRYAQVTRSLAPRVVLEPGTDEAQVADRLASLLRAFIPQAGPIMAHAFALHLRDQLRRDVLNQEQIASGAIPGAEDTAVGFADLVGFTPLGESLSAVDLGAVATRLAELVSDTLRPPVRMVKMIGDAAMLVSQEPAPLLDTSLDLVAAAEAEGEDFPDLKAGLAFGPALNRFGDYYGATVNLASRITSFARPGSVLVDEAFRGVVEPKNGYDWSFAGERRLKGLEHRVPLFRPRPAREGHEKE